MGRLVRENELSTTTTYNISDYSSSLSAKCADYTYLSQLSSNSTATSAYFYTGGTSSTKIATYKQFKIQALTASTYDIDVDVIFGNEAGGPGEYVVIGTDMGYGSLVGKYFVPGSIASSYTEQSSYVDDYFNSLFITTYIRSYDFNVTYELTGTPYGNMVNGINKVTNSIYAGARIGYISPTRFCHITATGKSASYTQQLYNESGLYYDNGKAHIAFGNYSTGDFNYSQILNVFGTIYLKYLNSGSNMTAGPGLYWLIQSSSGDVYIKVPYTERTFSGTKAIYKGTIYMPVNVFAQNET